MLVLLVVLGGAWLLFGRKRGSGSAKVGERPPAPAKPPAVEAVTMVACAHCGVHVPAADLLFDAAGLPFCSAAHRAAGPR